MNIQPFSVKGNCFLKCNYKFTYAEATAVATNDENKIVVTYVDANSIPSVSYNSAKYDVVDIKIVSPSIHTFDGKKADGEVLINHRPTEGGKNLYVCIPIQQISGVSPSPFSATLSSIINTISNVAPSSSSAPTGIDSFSLQQAIPMKPFYSYEIADYNVIVFSQFDFIGLSIADTTLLQTLITPCTDIQLGDDTTPFFINEKGPSNTLFDENEIYIQCRPTGSSTEETAVTYNKPYSTTDIWKNPWILYILFIIAGCIATFIIFYSFNWAIDYITTPLSTTSQKNSLS